MWAAGGGGGGREGGRGEKRPPIRPPPITRRARGGRMIERGHSHFTLSVGLRVAPWGKGKKKEEIKNNNVVS